MTVSVTGPFEEMGVDIEAGYTRGQTDDYPARIQVRVRNKSNEQREFFFGATPPLSTYTGVSNDGQSQLVLIPDKTENISVEEKNDDGEFRLIPESSDNDCWRVEDNIIRQDIVQARKLDPKESVSGAYTLLAGRENEPCLPKEEFTFSANLRIDQKEFDWELAVKTGNR